MTLPELSRRQIACYTFWAFFLFVVILLMCGGAPLLFAVIMSPFAFIGIIVRGGLCTLLWFALVIIQILMAGPTGKANSEGMRGVITPIIIGLTPQVIFLATFNGAIGIAPVGANDTTAG